MKRIGVIICSTLILTTSASIGTSLDSYTDGVASKERIPEPWSPKYEVVSKERIPEPWSPKYEIASKERIPEPFSSKYTLV